MTDAQAPLDRITRERLYAAMKYRSIAGAFGPFLASIADSRGRKAGTLFGLLLFIAGELAAETSKEAHSQRLCDYLTAWDQPDTLYGGGGNDELWGGADSDWLEGQKGSDKLYGGGWIDILVLDMIMDPGIDGLETYRRIVQINPGQKGIITSGFSESKRVHEARKLGAGIYVKKPYRLDAIARAVKAVLEK